MTADASPDLAAQQSGFDEPWQVRAFAMVNLMIKQDLIPASYWSTCLGAKRRVDLTLEHGYWRDWLETIEEILIEKGVFTAKHLETAVSEMREARSHQHSAAPEPIAIAPAVPGRTP